MVPLLATQSGSYREETSPHHEELLFVEPAGGHARTEQSRRAMLLQSSSSGRAVREDECSGAVAMQDAVRCCYLLQSIALLSIVAAGARLS